MMSETEKYSELETNTNILDSEELKEEEETVAAETVDSSREQISQEQENRSVPDNETDETFDGEEVLTEDDQDAKNSALEAEIASLKSELEAQKEQALSSHNQYMRLNADFENFRRRTAKEKQDLERQAKKRTLIELLSVVDNFERARNQIKPANDGEKAIHKSYQGVYKTFVDSLKKIGVSAMRPEGEPFDPNYHEAMLREPTNEYPEGTVIEQLVRGYLLDDQVLRHAMVKVSTEVEDELIEDNKDSENGSENQE